MAFSPTYSRTEPTPEEVGEAPGPVLLEFGSPTCGYCLRAEPEVESALTGHADVRHVRIADGSGRPLGRWFGVKLWPTLVFLNNGSEIARLVRPRSAQAIREALQTIDARSH